MSASALTFLRKISSIWTSYNKFVGDTHITMLKTPLVLEWTRHFVTLKVEDFEFIFLVLCFGFPAVCFCV